LQLIPTFASLICKICEALNASLAHNVYFVGKRYHEATTLILFMKHSCST